MVWPAAIRRRWAIPSLAQSAAAPARTPGRVRVPPPLISRRLPSGRGATEQPNVTGDGAAALSPRFWAMLALTGVAAGLFGDLMMYLLFGVQHLAFGYQPARWRRPPSTHPGCAGSPCC